MADLHGQIPLGNVENVNNEVTQDPNETALEGEEEVIAQVRNDPHLHPPESTVPAAQNGGRAPLQQPDMIILMDQLMKKNGSNER